MKTYIVSYRLNDTLQSVTCYDMAEANKFISALKKSQTVYCGNFSVSERVIVRNVQYLDNSVSRIRINSAKTSECLLI